MMVQYVIDCLSKNPAPPWLESADPAVSFTFAGGEKAHSETRIWLPLPGTRHERFAVHIVPSEVTPIFLGLDMLREVLIWIVGEGVSEFWCRAGV